MIQRYAVNDYSIDTDCENGEYVLYIDYLAEVDRLMKENEKPKEYKADIEDKFKIIMAEKCPSDEIHCACVPFLRMEVDRLMEELKLNATMLARQCDLAREAETKAKALRGNEI